MLDNGGKVLGSNRMSIYLQAEKQTTNSCISILVNGRAKNGSYSHEITNSGVSNSRWHKRQFREMLYSHGISSAALEGSLSREECVIKKHNERICSCGCKKKKHSTLQNFIIDTDSQVLHITDDTTNETFFRTYFLPNIFSITMIKPCIIPLRHTVERIEKNKLKRVLQDVSFRFKLSSPIWENQNKVVPLDRSFYEFDCNERRIPCEKQKELNNDETLHKRVRKYFSIPKSSYFDIWS